MYILIRKINPTKSFITNLLISEQIYKTVLHSININEILSKNAYLKTNINICGDIKY